jgi:putative lipoic acid-binding regulatory protein
MSNKSEFYDKLKTTLKEETKFPTKYLFKFIVPTSEESIQQIENIFNDGGAVINKNVSKTGKFTSVSIHIVMKSAEAIIDKYLQAEKVEGIISL